VFANKVTWTKDDDGEDFYYVAPVLVKNNTITLPVWEINEENKTAVPYTGNATLVAGNKFGLLDYERGNYYKNKTSITFTNGNATINFGTQVEFNFYFLPGEEEDGIEP